MSVYRGVLLYGDSGAGKSSLLNAGLMPLLIERGFTPVRIRVQPREDAEFVIEPWSASDDPDSAPTASNGAAGGDLGERMILSVSGFRDYIARVMEDRRPFLIFDQFEELVTLFDTPAAQKLQRRLTALIAELLHGPLRVKLLLAFRDDYLGKLKELLADCPELVDQALRLAPPSVDALPTIISGPFDRYPDHFEHPLPPAVREQLIDALAERFGTGEVSLSEVQTVCLRLWQSDTPDVLLEQRGVQGLLEDYLGEAIDQMPPQLQGAAIALLAQMITDAGTRNVISAADLFQRVREHEARQTPVVLEQALERLSQSRLVRRERRRDLDLYEITTEFLVPWISHRREEHRQRRERRRLIIVGSIAAALVLVAAGVAVLAIWALNQRRDATRQATRASSLALGATAQSQLGNRLDIALGLALAAIEVNRSGQALSSMTSALERVQQSGVVGIMHGDTGPIEDIAVSPDGKTVVSGSDDGTLRFWNVTAHTQEAAVRAVGGVQSVAFSPDGSIVAGGTLTGRVQLWSADSHTLLSTLPARQSGVVFSVVISPDGHNVVIGSGDGNLTVWDIQDPEHPAFRSRVQGNTGAIFSAAFSPNGHMLAAGSAYGKIQLWDIRNPAHPALLRILPGNVGDVYGVVFDPTGRTLAAASDGDGRVRLWNLSAARPVTLIGRSAHAYSLAFDPERNLVAAGGDNGTVEVWNVHSHASFVLSTPETGNGGIVRAVAFTPSGETMMAGGFDSTIRVWNLNRHPGLGIRLAGAPGVVRSVAISADGQHIATGGFDGAIRLWSLNTDSEVGPPLKARDGPVRSLSFSSDSQVLAAGYYDGRVALWDMATGERLARFRDDPSHVWSVAFARMTNALAVGGTDGHVRLWDTSDRMNPRLTQVLPSGSGGINDVAFSPDGRTLAAAGRLGPVRLWTVTHPTSATLASTLTENLAYVNAVNGLAFSPDGRTLATAGDDDTVRLWSLSSHTEIGSPLTGHTGLVYTVEFSSDGRYLLSAGTDSTVRLWDTQSHIQLGLPLTGEINDFYSAVFFPGSYTVVAVGWSGVRTWHDIVLPSSAALRAQVCGILGRGLSPSEWARYAPGIGFLKECP